MFTFWLFMGGAAVIWLTWWWLGRNTWTIGDRDMDADQ